MLEVRQVELDQPSDDPSDRLHASAHAWASDTASDLTIEVVSPRGDRVGVTTPVVEPGPLIAMKLQAVMNRSADKQGTDLLDIVRVTFDEATRPVALAQLAGVDTYRLVSYQVRIGQKVQNVPPTGLEPALNRF